MKSDVPPADLCCRLAVFRGAGWTAPVGTRFHRRADTDRLKARGSHRRGGGSECTDGGPGAGQALMHARPALGSNWEEHSRLLARAPGAKRQSGFQFIWVHPAGLMWGRPGETRKSGSFPARSTGRNAEPRLCFVEKGPWGRARNRPFSGRGNGIGGLPESRCGLGSWGRGADPKRGNGQGRTGRPKPLLGVGAYAQNIQTCVGSGCGGQRGPHFMKGSGLQCGALLSGPRKKPPQPRQTLRELLDGGRARFRTQGGRRPIHHHEGGGGGPAMLGASLDIFQVRVSGGRAPCSSHEAAESARQGRTGSHGMGTPHPLDDGGRRDDLPTEVPDSGRTHCSRKKGPSTSLPGIDAGRTALDWGGFSEAQGRDPPWFERPNKSRFCRADGALSPPPRRVVGPAGPTVQPTGDTANPLEQRGAGETAGARPRLPQGKPRRLVSTPEAVGADGPAKIGRRSAVCRLIRGAGRKHSPAGPSGVVGKRGAGTRNPRNIARDMARPRLGGRARP